MKQIILAAALAVAAPAAFAQEFYAGVGADVSVPHSGDTSFNYSVLGGAQFEGRSFNYGAEFEYGFAGGADYTPVRLRGLIRKDLGDFGLLAGVGASAFLFDSTEEFAPNISVGGDYAISATGKLRAEVIRDFMDDSTPVTNVRVAMTKSF